LADRLPGLWFKLGLLVGLCEGDGVQRNAEQYGKESFHVTSKLTERRTLMRFSGERFHALFA
jgi:hypothetical protein